MADSRSFSSELDIAAPSFVPGRSPDISDATAYSVSSSSSDGAVTLSVIKDRLRHVNNKKVIFIDGDSFPQCANILLDFIGSSPAPDIKEFDFIIVVFIHPEANFASFSDAAKLPCFLYTRALTDSKDAADHDLSMLASIANRFLLSADNSLYVMSYDGFARECVALLESMNQGRDIRRINEEMYRDLIINNKKYTIPQLEMAVRETIKESKSSIPPAAQIATPEKILDFRSQILENVTQHESVKKYIQRNQFMVILYAEYLAQGIKSVLMSTLGKRLRERFVFSSKKGLKKLVDWAEENHLVRREGEESFARIDINEENILKHESVKKYIEQQQLPVTQSITVPQIIFDSSIGHQTLLSVAGSTQSGGGTLSVIEDRLRSVTDEKIILVDGDNVLGAASMLRHHFLSQPPHIKLGFLVVAFYGVGAHSRHVEAATPPCLLVTQALTDSKDAADHNLSMLAAIINEFLPPRCSLSVVSRDGFAHECVAFLKYMNERDIQLMSLAEYDDLIKAKISETRSGVVTQGLFAKHHPTPTLKAFSCPACDKPAELADCHWYWKCASKGQKNWQEATSLHQQQYDGFILGLQEEYLAQGKETVQRDKLEPLLRMRGLAYRGMNKSVMVAERALEEGLLIVESPFSKGDWSTAMLIIVREKVEEYLKIHNLKPKPSELPSLNPDAKPFVLNGHQ